MIFDFQTLFSKHSDHELLAYVRVEPEAEGTTYFSTAELIKMNVSKDGIASLT